LLEQVFFSGLQDHFTNARLKLSGNADILGICFYPDAFYPFVGIPVSEFKNVWLGANEIGFRQAATISEKLKETPDTVSRLALLEGELVSLLLSGKQISNDFRQIFQALKRADRADSQEQIAGFCRQNNVGERRLERMFSKYVGISASTFGTLDRFHNSMNRLIAGGYSKLSDLAYDNGYFDQMHFIRDLMRFAGNTPKKFASQNSSILQIAKLR
jgi:AraC-like DNA-binding protein